MYVPSRRMQLKKTRKMINAQQQMDSILEQICTRKILVEIINARRGIVPSRRSADRRGGIELGEFDTLLS